MFRALTAFLSLGLTVAMATPAMAAHHATREPKRAIVIAAFGTTVPEATPAITKMVERVRAAYPGVPVSLCYTASMIRAKLAKQDKKIPSLPEVLAALPDQKVTDVAVMSLQTIPGHEYNDLLRTAKAFSGLPKGLHQVVVSAPLLFSPEDFPRVAKALLASAPKNRRPNEGLVFVGHGTDHSANMAYPALQYTLGRLDTNAFVTTVEGTPSFADVVAELQKRGIKKAWLLPMFAVAGDHAHNDMAGKDKDSLASTLAAAGIAATPIFTGNGERDAVAAIWMDHLKTVFDALPKTK